MTQRQPVFQIGDTVRNVLSREVGVVSDGWYIPGNGWLVTVVVDFTEVYEWWEDSLEGVRPGE